MKTDPTYLSIRTGTRTPDRFRSGAAHGRDHLALIMVRCDLVWARHAWLHPCTHRKVGQLTSGE